MRGSVWICGHEMPCWSMAAPNQFGTPSECWQDCCTNRLTHHLQPARFGQCVHTAACLVHDLLADRASTFVGSHCMFALPAPATGAD